MTDCDLKQTPSLCSLDDLAGLFSNHKAIPFLGTGCSSKIVPLWDQLRDEMAREIDITSRNHLFVAQKYEEHKGRSGLIQFLKDRLRVENVQEADVPVYSALLAMNLGWYYTTNQDNVFEKLFMSLGRQLDVVADLEDVVSRDPRIPVLTAVRFRFGKIAGNPYGIRARGLFVNGEMCFFCGGFDPL